MADDPNWMSLANMIYSGATSVLITCACGREASVNVEGLPGHWKVPAMHRRYRCSACGKKPVRARPDWPKVHTARAW